MYGLHGGREGQHLVQDAMFLARWGYAMQCYDMLCYARTNRTCPGLADVGLLDPSLLCSTRDLMTSSFSRSKVHTLCAATQVHGGWAGRVACCA